MAVSSNTVALALAMGLSPASAVALPTVLDVSAGKVGMTRAAIVAEALVNKPLRDYLASVCVKVIADEIKAAEAA